MTFPTTSPGRTFRRSQVALGIGILLLGISALLAVLLDVKGGDLFAGLMAGAGAIGALMAAYEAADAAENAAAAANRANELTIRQSLPTLVITVDAAYFVDTRLEQTFTYGYIRGVTVDNVGLSYTASIKLSLYIYSEGERRAIYGFSSRLLFPANTACEHHLKMGPSELLALKNMDGYGVEITTIHGTVHSALGWVIESKDVFFTMQLDTAPLPEQLPRKPREALVS